MLSRRDIASITLYGLIFAAVVVWAELRPTNPDLIEMRGSARASMTAAPDALSEDRGEMRHLVKHTRNP